MPFSALPHQSKLFLDYLRDPVSLKRYYPNAVASFLDISSFVPQVLTNYKSDRNRLCDALVEINSNAGACDKTFDNITILSEADTVAVVTGQQAGLFSGPLYTVYKALSAIKISAELNAAGIKAVPVFWVATEDHDLDEISQTHFIDNAGGLTESRYRPESYAKYSPVGNIVIDSAITNTIDHLFDALPATEFSGSIRDSLKECWSPGSRIGDAFSKNLASILGRFGIIIIDPMHPGIKSLASPIYVDAIEKSAEVVSHIRKKGSELKTDGYHVQVLVEEDYFPLFRIDDEGRRVALRKVVDGVYRSREENKEFSIVELASIARDEPARFSPGVMLRPVVQDYLLPTVCYFGGAAEIAYFAQNSAAYRVLDRPVTPIMHRQSLTVVEAKHRRALDKFGLGFTDLFDGSDRIVERVGAKQLSPGISADLDSVEESIGGALDRLDQDLSQIDRTLSDSLAKRRKKIMHHIAALQKSAARAQARKDATIERQIKAALDTLLPNGELQERILNVHSFINKYGEYFIDMLYDAVDLNDQAHRIIEL